MEYSFAESQNIKSVIDNIIKNIGSDKDIGIHLSDFEILQVLGKGGYSFVAKVKSKINLRIYAMKKTDLSLISNPKELKYYINESLFMKKLDHPNVCKCYSSFQENNFLYMIIDFMDNGDLMQFLDANWKMYGKINEDKLWDILKQCLEGLVYLHSLGLIHRDIKPTNILMNSNGEIKFSDFNISVTTNIEKAKHFTEDNEKEELLINNMTKVGSGQYKAPEIQNLNISCKKYDEKVDIYSLGITFCALTFHKIRLPLNCYKFYSKELVDIIRKMINEDPIQRPSSEKLYNIFIKEYAQKYLHSSGLISCINCLSLYDSIKYYFLGDQNNVNPLNEISFNFNKVINFFNNKKEILHTNDSISQDTEEEGFNCSIYKFREILSSLQVRHF